jgi:hypothetical protein
MKRETKKTKGCLGDGEMLAYMYDELSAGARDAFERHLPDCVLCTDEFAALADTRYSVYEWHKLEFVPMETPAIAIPYRDAEKAGTYGWMASLRGTFDLSSGWAASGAFAAVAVTLGVLYFVQFGGITSKDVAGLTIPPVEDANLAEVSNALPEGFDPSGSVAGVTVAAGDGVDEPDQAESEATPVRTSVRSTRPNRNKGRSSRGAARSSPAVVTVNAVEEQAPRLNEFDDLSDDSLRLADLVADLDTSDE